MDLVRHASKVGWTCNTQYFLKVSLTQVESFSFLRLTFDPRLIRLLARQPSTLMVRFFPSKSNSMMCCLSSLRTA